MPNKNMKITVLGAGNMGTTIAQIIATNGYEVHIWNYEGDPDPLEHIIEYRENKKYLPGIKLSERIKPEKNLEQALQASKLIFFVVPSSFMVSILKRAHAFISREAVLVDISKGFQEKDWKKKTKKITVEKILSRMVVVSGPAIAVDLVKGGFTAMNIASSDNNSIRTVKKVLENEHLKLVASSDIKGIKLCGALKNVYAILMGICDGLSLPMNTKAFLLTRSLEEMSGLVKKLGGKKETVYSLAGLGDLIGTGLCATSRNRRFGEFLVYAKTREEAQQKVGQVVEGVEANKMLVHLAGHYGVAMPVAQLIYKIVWKNVDPKKELELFLQNFKI
jgi:glycerol-3-phosphate dehydrogenase (NAD(P)+)